MAELATVASGKTREVIGETFLKGKLVARTRIGKSFVHVIAAPAPDEYSYPRNFEVRSKSSLGDIDDMVTVRCSIFGKRAMKNYTDKDTGESRKFPGAYMDLEAIED